MAERTTDGISDEAIGYSFTRAKTLGGGNLPLHENGNEPTRDENANELKTDENGNEPTTDENEGHNENNTTWTISRDIGTLQNGNINVVCVINLKPAKTPENDPDVSEEYKIDELHDNEETNPKAVDEEYKIDELRDNEETNPKTVDEGSIENVGSIIGNGEKLHFYKDTETSFLSIGKCCKLVKITINEESIASKDFRVNVDDNLISLMWEGNNSDEVNTNWKIKFLNPKDDEQLTNRIMELLQGDEFKQLRELVEELNKKHEAKLRHINRGCIQLILAHRDMDSAKRAIEDRREILEIFIRLILKKCQISTDVIPKKKREVHSRQFKDISNRQSSRALLRGVSELAPSMSEHKPISALKSYPGDFKGLDNNAEENFDAMLIKAQTILQKYGLVFILGGPGSGKTYVSKQLIEWMRQKDSTITTTTVNSPSELKDKFEHFKEDVIVVDLDKSDSSSHQLMEYAILMEKLFTFTGMTRHSRINCIFMGSERPDHSLSMFHLLRPDLLINLNQCFFTETNMKTIFKHFQNMHPQNIADFAICKSLIDKPTCFEVGIPLIVEMLTMFPKQSDTILEEPLQYIIGLLQRLEKEEKDLFLCLLVLFLADGELKSTEIQTDISMILDILSQTYEVTISLNDILSRLKEEQLRFFIKRKKNDTLFEFTHSLYGKVIFSTFSQRYMEIFIMKFPVNALCHLRPISSKENGYVEFLVESECYQLLVSRILEPSDLIHLNQEFIVDYDFISEYIRHSNAQPSDILTVKYQGSPLSNFLFLHGSYQVCEFLFGLIEIQSLPTDDGGWSILHCSVASPIDSIKKIELLKLSIDFDAKDSKGNTPLHVAAFLNRTDVFEYLLTSGANPQMSNLENKTPIYTAVERGFEELLNVIKRSGAMNKNIQQCLKVAEDQGNDTIIRRLREQRPLTPTCPEPILSMFLSSYTPSTGNVKESHLRDMIKSNVPEDELQKFLVNVLHKREVLDRSLLFAVESLNVVAVRALCEAGSVADTQDDNGFTPLHVACLLDQLEISRYLLQYTKPSINLQDLDGNTPLHIAVRYKREEIVNLLLNFSTVDTNVKNRNNDTILHIAAKYSNVRILQNIINKSPTLMNNQNFDDQTPLHVAISWKKDSLAKALIDKMDNFTIEDKNGSTCLELAVYHSHEDVLSSMLRNETDMNRVNANHETLLHIAAKSDKPNHAKCLIEKGADVNSSLPDGQTPLHVAASYDSINVTKILLENNVIAMKTDKRNYTALHYATTEEMRRLLENRGCTTEKRNRCSIM